MLPSQLLQESRGFEPQSPVVPSLSPVVPLVPRGGNTKPPLSPVKDEGKGPKRPTTSKRWCFTWNNYPENWLEIIGSVVPKIDGYYMGREICPTTGTPHIQGYVEFKEKVRPMGLFPKQVSWRKAKGNKLSNWTYNSKEDKNVECYGTCRRVRLPKFIESLRPWQQEIVDICNEETDDRTIRWIYDESGGAGKSALTRYMCGKMDALVTGGRCADMKYQLAKYVEVNGTSPNVVIMDIPRSMGNLIQYEGVEEIKNGCFSSSKYESGMVLMPHCHVLIFANYKPDLSRLSSDRWWIREIKDGKLIETQ